MKCDCGYESQFKRLISTLLFPSEKRGRSKIAHLGLPRKHVLVVKVLQLLVGDVDAELLEAVVRQVFKAKDVQHANSVLYRLLKERVNEIRSILIFT